MKCEKCGEEIKVLEVDEFNYEGADAFQKYFYEEVPDNAVYFDTRENWTGAEQDEEEQRETIRCPKCKQFPFKNGEIQTYTFIRVVMFKSTERGEE